MIVVYINIEDKRGRLHMEKLLKFLKDRDLAFSIKRDKDIKTNEHDMKSSPEENISAD